MYNGCDKCKLLYEAILREHAHLTANKEELNDNEKITLYNLECALKEFSYA